MKIMTKLLKDEHDAFLINTTVLINETNPVVDRIMDDDTVHTVVMANKEGYPILTNSNIPIATRYSTRMRLLANMVHHMLKELDPFDEALVFRMKSCKEEVLVAPHREFSIIVVQREDKKPKKQPNMQLQSETKPKTSVK